MSNNDAKSADVIIVGGGPAGSSAAYMLARQGLHVLVLEKQKMPRYKTCGGGVNIRAARHIPFSIEPVIEKTIYKYRFTYRGEKPFEKAYDEPLTYMTQRLRLDQFLLDQACEQGAQVIEEASIRKIAVNDDAVTVEDADGKTYRSLVLIGADGANSIVARQLQLSDGVQREIALESEVSLPAEIMARWADTIELDLFSVWCGYGWIFPKKDHISIGVGGPQKLIKQIKAYNTAYLSQNAVAEYPTIRFSGHALPVRKGFSPLTKGRALLVGDAAGLLEPFTGEGIGYAVRSGQLAARAIEAFLKNEAADLTLYTHLLDQELTPELLSARQFVQIFNRFPALFYHLIKNNDYVWGAICKILRGERNFNDINRKLGFFKYALPLLSTSATPGSARMS
ncbi:MAG TPA: geranylgeranyl reductase family protein [Ktedonobacteraceae bacterium]